MSRKKWSIGWRSGCKISLSAFFFVASFALMAELSSQTGLEARQGAFQVRSALGRKLYALPDDEKVIEAPQESCGRSEEYRARAATFKSAGGTAAVPRGG